MDDENEKELRKIFIDSSILCYSTFSADQLQDILFQIIAPCTWTKLFDRNFVVKNGLKFQSLENTNDLFFTKNALTQAKRMVGSKKSVSYIQN